MNSYSFTPEDINLITYALRRLADSTNFAGLQSDSRNLIEYIERLKQEQKIKS